jgi:sirohydrochlorin ferrochelatase
MGISYQVSTIGFLPALSFPARYARRKMEEGQGIIIFAHGSRIESANEAVRSAAAEVARQGGLPFVEAAFLELGKPDLEGAVLQLASQGVRSILVIPYFLTLGLHLERDLPRIAQDISNKYRELEIRLAPPLDGHPALVQVLLDRVRGA